MTLERALGLHQNGQLAAAKQAYLTLLRPEPQCRVLYFLSILESELSNPLAAIEAIQQAIAISPFVPDYQVLLGKLQLQNGLLEDAHQAFKKATMMQPCAEHFFLLGQVNQHLGDLDAAKKSLKEAAKCDPTHVETLLHLGLIYDAEGKEQRSLQLWTNGHQAAPQHPQICEVLAAWYGRAAELKFSSDPRSALQHIETALTFLASAALLHQRAELLLALGNLEDAERSCLEAIVREQNPVFYHTLGNIYRTSQKPEHALEAYQMAKALGSDHPATERAIDSLTGASTAESPEVVELIFDQYAERFEAHLTHLGYDIPQKLRLLMQTHQPNRQLTTALDLGCGTGMSIIPFLACTEQRVGIDLSEQMLAKAAEKGCYDALHKGNLREWLSACQDSYELVISADTFVYTGALDFFADLARIIPEGGLLLFSVEQLSEGDYALQPSDRYAHSSAYVAQMAQPEFQVLATEETAIRMAMDQPVMGTIWMLQRTADATTEAQ